MVGRRGKAGGADGVGGAGVDAEDSRAGTVGRWNLVCKAIVRVAFMRKTLGRGR